MMQRQIQNNFADPHMLMVAVLGSVEEIQDDKICYKPSNHYK
jgi:hypothetical protein